MITLSGKGVYGSIAFGRISVFKRKEASVKRTRIDDVEAEKARLGLQRKRLLHSFRRYMIRH